MKGNFKITVEQTRPQTGGFDITEKWTMEQDNLPELYDDVIEVFEGLLHCMGFHFTGRLDIVEED